MSPPAHPPPAERGQATLEYTAVVALVAIVLATVGSLVGAPSITNAVGRQMRHALCVVTGDRCATVDPQPCVVRSRSVRGSVTAKLAVVRVGRGISVLRVERSDGTIDLTLLDDASGAIEAGLGARGELDIGDRVLGAGGIVEAQIIVTLGGGTTWRVRGRAQADALQRKLAHVAAGRAVSSAPAVGGILAIGQHLLHVGDGERLPEPRSRSVSVKAAAQVQTALGPSADLAVTGGAMLGAQRAHDGTLTLTFAIDGSAGTTLAASAGVLRALGTTTLSVVIDPHGTLLTATLSGVGTLAAGVSPPGASTRAGTSGGQVRVQSSLDLTEPAAAAALRGLTDALRPAHALDLPGAAAALGERFLSDGAIDVGLYRSSSSSVGASGEAAAGAGAGIGARLDSESASLIGAWSRPPHGAWETRLDCVAYSGP